MLWRWESGQWLERPLCQHTLHLILYTISYHFWTGQLAWGRFLLIQVTSGDIVLTLKEGDNSVSVSVEGREEVAVTKKPLNG